MSLLLQRPAPAAADIESSEKRPTSNPFPPRPVPSSWPGTRRGREEILEVARVMPMITSGRDGPGKRLLGLGCCWIG